MSSAYTQHLNDVLGGEPSFITHEGFQNALTSLTPDWVKLKTEPDACTAAILRSCADDADLADIESLASSLKAGCEHLLVIGSGGSGLSAKALCPLAPYPKKPLLHVIDHIDPLATAGLIRSLPLEKTSVILVSKSGQTVETLSVAATLFSHAKSQGVDIAQRTIVITIAKHNPLRAFAAAHSIRTLEHDADLCGRFSVLSAVGLLPAAIMGVDIRALRAGARGVIDACVQANSASDVEPAKGSCMQAWMMQNDKPLSVLMAYGEAFAGLVWWYRQGWAESLGKNGLSATPYASFGPCDQHSQLQLYLDGPRDKSFTLLIPDCKGSGDVITLPEQVAASAPYLQGRTLGDVMAAEAQATFESMLGHGLPIRLLRTKAMDEQTLGALFAHFMLEIIFTARLTNVDPFNQPAVEESKTRARQYLTDWGRK